MLLTVNTYDVTLRLAWQKEMMWAALEGSALNGRPLRMTSCGLMQYEIKGGYSDQDPDAPNRYLVSNMTDWCNANQMYSSIHVHYITYDDAIESITKFTGTGSYTNPPWNLANWRIATEVGNKEDYTGDAWWGEVFQGKFNVQLQNQYIRQFGLPDPTTNETWEDFINRWEAEADSWTPPGVPAGFKVGDVMDTFAQNHFTAICWSAMQFDPGSPIAPSAFLGEALRANDVKTNLFEQGNQVTWYTPVMTYYETAGAAYTISPFDPHGCTDCCKESDVCPMCGN